jgi:hypothetical protein
MISRMPTMVQTVLLPMILSFLGCLGDYPLCRAAILFSPGRRAP